MWQTQNSNHRYDLLEGAKMRTFPPANTLFTWGIYHLLSLCPYIVNIDCHAVPLLSDLPNKHKQQQLQSHKFKHQHSHKQSHNVSANKHSPVSKSKPSSVYTSSTPAADKQQGSRKTDNKKKPPLFVHGKQHLLITTLVWGLQWALMSRMQLLEPTSHYSN